jgi:FMN-dependent NADH-azoreductase
MMILHLDASARTTRSLSRRLSRLFIDTWSERRPSDRVIYRDLAADPPPHVSEAWIAAAFTPPEKRDAAMLSTLAWSDAAIAEVEAAELIVLGTPMYNYGMPSALKAWFDQVIRIGRTFSFDLARGDQPIEPMLHGKRLVVLSARGEFGFAPGGVRERLNQLDPHLATCAPFLGVAPDAVHTIAIEYQEFGDERHARSVREAEIETAALAARLCDPGRASAGMKPASARPAPRRGVARC